MLFFKRNNESYNAVTILVITTSCLVIFAPQERGAYGEFYKLNLVNPFDL